MLACCFRNHEECWSNVGMTRTPASAPAIPFRLGPVRVAAYAAFTMLVVVVAAYLVFEGITQPIALPKVIAGATYGAIMVPGIMLLVNYFEKADRRTSMRTVLLSSGFSFPRSIWTAHRPVEPLLLGIVAPVVLVFVWLRVLDPLLRSATSITPAIVSTDRINWYSGLPTGLVIVSIASGVIWEEVLFRGPGLLLWQLRDSVESRISRHALTVVSIVGGGLLSTVAFGYHHGNQGAWNVLLGCTFGALFYPLALATRSLWPSIIGHLVWNLDAWGIANWLH